jgi:hypothetical protein
MRTLRQRPLKPSAPSSAGYMVTCIKRDPLGTEPVVIGPRKRARSTSPVAAENLAKSDAGSCRASGAGTSRAHASLQIALAKKACRHQHNQRRTVRAPARSTAPARWPARPPPPRTRACPETAPTAASHACGTLRASSRSYAATTTPQRPERSARPVVCGGSPTDPAASRTKDTPPCALPRRPPRRSTATSQENGHPPRARESRGYLVSSQKQVSARGTLEQVFCGRCAFAQLKT